MNTLMLDCRTMADDAHTASKRLAIADTAAKNAWLLACAARMESETTAILSANAIDLAAAPSAGLNAAAIDRLTLSPKRIAGIVESIRQVAALPDPVGEVREGGFRPNGLQVLKVGVPLGVIFFLFESRPNVTADAAALCVKSGNAVILRGGKEAMHSNAAIHAIFASELQHHGLPDAAVQLVKTPDRDAVGHFLTMNDRIDLVIPRGGESLIRRVSAEATMPVLKHFHGNCHVYVDAAADAEMAERIVVNAKCQRPGTCNAAESLLVHEAVAAMMLPRIAQALIAHGVTIRGCPVTCTLVPQAAPATDKDFATEYLDLIISVNVVPSLSAAMAHIARYGSQHSEAIITNDFTAAQVFTRGVDAACVLVNASTRFNDGFELGLGSEIGISTDKFHARGPCGLRELTTYKYVVTGSGQVRDG
jgi:glutamate-5-semialdehyde dehydrogenase